MAGLNKILLIGNVGRDAELTYLPSGRPKLFFTLATNQNYKDKEGQWQKDTCWHRVVMWGDMAVTRSDQIKKGKQVYVEGRISTRTFQGKDGHDRTITEVTALHLLLLGKPPDGASAADGASAPQSSPAPMESEDAEPEDETPF